MSALPQVVQVWFGNGWYRTTEEKWGPSPPPFRYPEPWASPVPRIDSFAGVALWVAPDGGHVFEWAIEPTTCTDERWALFGPFNSAAAAVEALAVMARLAERPYNGLRGYRLFNEHCVIECFRGSVGTSGAGKPDCRPMPWPRRMWTDG